MTRPFDLRELLARWPYDPQDHVRQVRGEDGREILQVRLPLGIEQYELEGRPDGQRPHGRESFLDYHLERLSQATARGLDTTFRLSSEQCAELFAEGVLYYSRYLHLFQHKDWPRTVRDTARNLRLFDFVQRYAEREEDQGYLEQWRPYILRINAMARTMIELEGGHHDRALELVNAALANIESLPGLADETFQFERRRSLLALRELAEQIEQTRPVQELELLQRQLRDAIELQAFERAAQLRDRIRALQKRGSPPVG